MWLESSRGRLQIFAISAQLPPRMNSHQHMPPSFIHAQSHVHFYVLNIHSEVCCCKPVQIARTALREIVHMFAKLRVLSASSGILMALHRAGSRAFCHRTSINENDCLLILVSNGDQLILSVTEQHVGVLHCA